MRIKRQNKVLDLIASHIQCTQMPVYSIHIVLYSLYVRLQVAGCYSCFLSDYSGLVSPPGTPSRRSPTLHIPTDNNLSSPIRHYISESLICQVLGQPSFSLTCLLVSSVVEYMGIVVSLHKPITIEEICKMVGLTTYTTIGGTL